MYVYMYLWLYTPWSGDGVWWAGTKFVRAGLICCLGGRGLATTVRGPRPLPPPATRWAEPDSSGMTGELSPPTVTICGKNKT